MDWLILFFLGFLAQKIYWKITKSDRWKALWIYRQNPLWCNGHYGPCRHLWGLVLSHPQSMYPWDEKGGKHKDPNRPTLMCKRCDEAHQEDWDDMWAEYNSGRL